MNIELHIIKHLLNKETYNKYISYINVSKELQKHYKVLEELHTSTNNNLTLDEYTLHAEQQGCDYLDVLKESNVSEDSLEKLVKTLSERSWAHTQALLLVEVAEGRRELSDALEHYSNIENIVASNKHEEMFITDSLDELSLTTNREAGLKWRLPPLQEALGGLNKGDFGFIFARPETGKTTFLASEVSFFAEQIDKPIIWFNNEERGDKVKARIYQAALGIDSYNLFLKKEINQEMFLQKTKGNVKLYDKGFIHKKEVERVVKEQQPGLIIFDQIDKIRGFKADREDLQLGAIYIWARELAKEYCPIIGVCQASASAENKKWLGMDDVAKSKTEKAAEADFIIGVGKTYDVGMEEIRYLHLIKNKLTGIHDRIQCRINATIARYEEL